MKTTGSDCPCGHSEAQHHYLPAAPSVGCRECSCDIRAFEVDQRSVSIFDTNGRRLEWRSLAEHLRRRK